MMTGNTLLFQEKNDKNISFAVCLQITIVGIKNMLVQAVPFFYARNAQLNILLLLIVGAVYVWTFIRMKKTISKHFLISIWFVILSFTSTLLFFPENKNSIINALPRALPYCFITCYFLSELRSFEWLKYYMGICSIVTLLFSFISAIFIFLYGHITTSMTSSYSMTLSYVTMVAVMWLLYRYFNEERSIWLLLASLGIAIIIAYGSRNPLLAIASYIIISVLKKVLSKQTENRIWFVIIALLGCIFMIWWRECLQIVGDILAIIGVSSRTINLMVESTISTSGRDVIHSELLSALNKHPFWGYGVLGDEVVLSNISQSAHSLYLSILSNYGYFVGCFILCILFYWNYRAFRCSNKMEKDFLLIYMCLVWPRGFTGGDIWGSDVFWWLLGLILSRIAYSKKSIEYEKSTTYY